MPHLVLVTRLKEWTNTYNPITQSAIGYFGTYLNALKILSTIEDPQIPAVQSTPQSTIENSVISLFFFIKTLT